VIEYVTRKPLTQNELPPVLVVLHGYGADENDLLPIADQLGPEFLIISLRAPIPLPQGGYAWYHLEQTPGGLIPDELSRHESEDAIVESLAAIIEREGGDPHDVVLMGFSQGAAMCYSMVTLFNFHNHGFSARCIIAMSGYLPRDILEALTQKHFAGFSFFISHGEFDDLIPPIALKEAEDLLSKHGAKVTANMYEAGHGVSPETVGDIVAWLGKL
jgi:phospholipase/carboxylesterase